MREFHYFKQREGEGGGEGGTSASSVLLTPHHTLLLTTAVRKLLSPGVCCRPEVACGLVLHLKDMIDVLLVFKNVKHHILGIFLGIIYCLQ